MAAEQHTAPNPSFATGRALVGPDAELIARAKDFLATEAEEERRSERFHALPVPWSAADMAEWECMTAEATGYHDRLAAIIETLPQTPAGLAAMAHVVLCTMRDPSPDMEPAYQLARATLKLLGEPLPAWAADPDAGEVSA